MIIDGYVRDNIMGDMSVSSIDDIKSGKGLKKLQGENSSKSGITIEYRSGDGTYYSGGDISEYHFPLWMTSSSAIPRKVTKDENKESKMTNKETNRMNGMSKKLNDQLTDCMDRCKELSDLCEKMLSNRSFENVEEDKLKQISDSLSIFNYNIIIVQCALLIYDSIGKKKQENEKNMWGDSILDDDKSTEDEDMEDEEYNLSLLFAKMLKEWPR